MPKLLIVTTVSSTIKAFLLPYAQHFRNKGWQVDALTNVFSPNDVPNHLFDHVWNVRWTRNPMNLNQVLRMPNLIREIVEEQNYDIVHVHTPVAAFITRYALRKLREQKKVKIIYTAHGFHFHEKGNRFTNSIYRYLERLAGKWTDFLVVINAEDQLAARELALVPPNNLVYMRGIGIDTQNYSPQRSSREHRQFDEDILNAHTEIPLFLMVAEFIPRKRHSDLLRAFAHLEHQNAHLLFAGTGKLLEEIKLLTNKLGLENRVHFLGQRDDIPELMRIVRATILPSSREGLPRSIMESLSLETPVIGTRIRGITELLDPDCGLLVPVGDITALTQAMDWLLNNPSEAIKMGKRGRERMVSTYDLKFIIEQHENLYERCLLNKNDFSLNNHDVFNENQVTS